MATHLGVIDEEAIDNMSYVFFESIMAHLGYKLIFEAVSNYAGNSFCPKSWDMIMKQYPLKNHEDKTNGLQSVANLFSKNAKYVERRTVPRPPKGWKEMFKEEGAKNNGGNEREGMAD